ncbi:SRPBCC domain-containing protein [Demetria terragena]|uniref:SRPBCC domain-containing protein n=1 Tax=Demetria terragena TaxID=63959 RepID=UPI00037AD8E4|nr:SRPBCC domain-containing protein [Demetria terragena]
MSTPDTIKREITINAPLTTVWQLISTPGWWINDGEIIEHESSTDGDVTTLHWKGADFPIRTLGSDEPKSVSYEWGSGESDNPASDRTRIDMTLAETDAGVLVTVVESGFAAYADAAKGTKTQAENSQGWDQELAAARQHLEG